MLKKNTDLKTIGNSVLQKASEYDGHVTLDDMTVVTALSRHGRTLNIITGPPANKKLDSQIVQDFMNSPGLKAVCGATTAAITARVLGVELQIEKDATSLITPPKSFIKGIELVTEGAITLNQLNNVLDIPADDFDEINAVTELYDLLMQVDRIQFFLGTGNNTANADICFVQQGVLSRERVIPLIADKLRKKGKCVLIKSA